MAGSYDYIVVGAGSAGAVVASRLSEDADVSVLLLEAGGRDNHPFQLMPLAFQSVARSRPYIWNFESEPEPGLGGRRLPIRRGRTLGGSSSINALIASRGNRVDYDLWRQQGLAGWGYEDVLPYFRRLEDSWRGENEFHGVGGPIRISPEEMPEMLFEPVRQAAEAAGIPYCDDPSGPAQEGISRMEATSGGGVRASTARAYLRPAMGRANLRIETRAPVTRVVIEGGRAVGVEYASGRDLRRVYAAREVVLCGGSFNSPQLLMLSGVGPADELKAHGIVPVHDLPGVGRNLSEHPNFILQFGMKERAGLTKFLRIDRATVAAARWFLTRGGPFASNGATANVFLRTRAGLDRPDVQFIVMPVSNYARLWAPGLTAPPVYCFNVRSGALHPESRGSVRLRSADPADRPRIQFNLLTAQADLDTMVRGVRRCREMFAQEPLRSMIEREIVPGAAAQTDAELAAAIREQAGHRSHPVGTCRMGTGADAVVDAELRVRGIAGLRVADASVMPELPSGNTNLPVIMIGEKAADLIRGHIQPRPSTGARAASDAAPVRDIRHVASQGPISAALTLGVRQQMERQNPIPSDCAVLIVGGGPCGLMLANELGRRGVAAVLIDDKPSTAFNPQANATQARTMEHFRRLGFADEIRALGLPPDYPTDIAYYTRFARHELARYRLPSSSQAKALAPTLSGSWSAAELPHRISQKFVEAVLRKHAGRLAGISIHYGWRLVDFAERGEHVDARVERVADGAQAAIRAAYLVGADGPRSFVRQRLGYRYVGEAGAVRDFLGGRMYAVYLRAPRFYELVPHAPAWMNVTFNRDRRAFMAAVDGRGEFAFHTQLRAHEDEERITERDAISLFHAAAGAPIDAEVLSVGTWTAGYALVAERFHAGRIFIAGDAAHLFTPTGGLGYNTAVEDAVNLGWKLAAAIKGQGGAALLDSYELERRPLAIRNTGYARRFADSLGIEPDPAIEDATPEGEAVRARAGAYLEAHARAEFNIPGITFGGRYDGSPIVLNDGTAPPPESANTYTPSACPGGRPPHLWLGGGASLFDRFGFEWTLLRLGVHAPPAKTFAVAAAQLGIELEVVHVAAEEARDLYEADLALIRPDQIVAWRGNAGDNAGEILRAVLGHPAAGSHKPAI